eukprot:scaffold1604_cov127-Isochrysis_galbana.AAC.3
MKELHHTARAVVRHCAARSPIPVDIQRIAIPAGGLAVVGPDEGADSCGSGCRQFPVHSVRDDQEAIMLPARILHF